MLLLLPPLEVLLLLPPLEVLLLLPPLEVLLLLPEEGPGGTFFCSCLLG